MTKTIVDNVAGGLFMDLSFLDAADMLNRITKKSRSWNIWDSVVASPTISHGITIEQHRRDEERDQDMAYLKTLMDLLANHLLSGKTEMVKAAESQGTM